jgi:uncharacterized protein with GYD domain
MATYIILGKYTQEGTGALRHVAPVESMRQQLDSKGIRLKEFFVTFGSYDLILVAEADSAEEFAKFVVDVASQGYIATETLTGVSPDAVTEAAPA